MLRTEFNAVSKNNLTPGIKGFISEVLNERPDLRGQMIYIPERQGMHSYTVLIGDEIFKQPATLPGELVFEHECSTMKHLHAAGLPVPEVTCMGERATFVGMKRIYGVTMSNAMQHGMDAAQQQQLAEDIVAFLIQMAKSYEGKKGHVMTHMDLHPNNVIVNPQTYRLAGLIDFGHTGYRSTKRLMPGVSAFGRRFRRLMRAAYEPYKPAVKAIASP